jgi:hypothetical protein
VNQDGRNSPKHNLQDRNPMIHAIPRCQAGSARWEKATVATANPETDKISEGTIVVTR